MIPATEVKRRGYTEDNKKENIDAEEALENIVNVAKMFNKKFIFEL